MCCRYFIFTSFWAYKIYYVYGFMLLVFLILIVVTVCVTIVCTYFLLNAEDYRWFVALLVRTGSLKTLQTCYWLNLNLHYLGILLHEHTNTNIVWCFWFGSNCKQSKVDFRELGMVNNNVVSHSM